MSHHHDLGFDIGLGVALARNGVDTDARQRYVDNVFARASAVEDYQRRTGYIDEIGHLTLIEREGLLRQGLRPSAYYAQTGLTGPYALLLVVAGFLLAAGGWVISLFVLALCGAASVGAGHAALVVMSLVALGWTVHAFKAAARHQRVL